jgi:alkyl sulfatase BDS1-like metallo-beta-lactamase superfamily hydrolase
VGDHEGGAAFEELVHGLLDGPLGFAVERARSLVEEEDRGRWYMGVRLNGPNAAGTALTLNLELTDTGEQAVLELVNGSSNH